ncbi:MAG: Uncharacterized protein G01um101433_397 [Parcubacteria group bacterium Gr01-1014_33]|nr:MAG: Uncharacterized protein G01um101433_397 [Parcubacteria group bacterium Gr01-1014_33]
MENFKNYFHRRNLLFIVIFALLGLGALQVPFTRLAGSRVSFTLFDFFGPIAAGFIGTIPGIIAVALMQFFNFLLHGAEVVDAGTIIRFFPMLFAALYFGRKGKLNVLIPLIAIAVFNLHPVGRSVWYYSLYWLIPIACHFFRDRSLVARSLGATFTAHAVGGALWIWAFHLPKPVWVSLIPVVAMERILFTFGIAGAYVILNNLLYLLTEKKVVNLEFLINRKYVLSFIK